MPQKFVILEWQYNTHFSILQMINVLIIHAFVQILYNTEIIDRKLTYSSNQSKTIRADLYQ